MKREIKSYFILILLILWTYLIILGYYYFHKPINIIHAKSISISIFNIIVALGITTLAGGIGRSLYSYKSLDPVEELVVQAVLGFGLLSLFWLLIGLFIGYKIWIAWTLLILGFLFFRKAIFSWTTNLISSTLKINPTGGFNRIIFAGILIFLSNQLVIALSPPTSWDSLMYHLEIPKQYILAGKFIFLPENFYWGQPQLSELLYTWGGSLFRWETATTLNYFLVLLLLIGVYTSVSRISRSAALVSILALLVGETFRFSMSSGYVDGISALFGYAVFIIIIRSVEDRDVSQFNWIGIFLGLTAWVKLTNFILFPIVLISIIFNNIWQEIKWWKGFRVLFIGGLVFLPWLVTLLIFTGNPFYPHIFETSWINSVRYEFFKNNGTSPGLSSLWLPVATTWHGLHKVYIEGKLVFATDIGPLLLSLGGIGIITNFKDRKVIISAIWLFLGWMFMILGGFASDLFWQTRLYYSLIAPAALLVGYGWNFISQLTVHQVRPQKILGILLILITILTVVKDLDAVYKKDSYKVVIGTISRESYLDRNLGSYYSVSQEIQNLPQSSNVLMLWEPRGFYMPENVLADVWIDRWYITVQNIPSSTEIISEWKRKDFTHLLINENGMEFEKENNDKYDYTDWVLLQQTLKILPPPLKIGQGYSLYTLD